MSVTPRRSLYVFAWQRHDAVLRRKFGNERVDTAQRINELGRAAANRGADEEEVIAILEQQGDTIAAYLYLLLQAEEITLQNGGQVSHA